MVNNINVDIRNSNFYTIEKKGKSRDVQEQVFLILIS